MGKIRSAVDRDFEFTCAKEGGFGRWINGIFGSYEGISNFEEQKEAFFYLLERLLREGKVLLTPPVLCEDQEPYYWVIADGYSDNRPRRPVERTTDLEQSRFRVWDVPIEKQIAYIREVFPKDVKDPNDSELNIFWYDGRCPWIGWIHPDTGVLWAS